MFLAPALFLDPPKPPRDASWARTIGLNLLVAAAYVLTGYAGLRLAFVGHTVTLFWAPSGIAFAAVWLGGRRLAPGVAAGAYVVNLITGLPLAPTVVVAIGNTLAALAAVAMVGRAIRSAPGPGELKRVLWFVLLAVLGATLISATLGTLAVRWFTDLDAQRRWTWPVWWLGDAMGTLIAAPPILLWHRLAAAQRRPRDLLHAAAFAIVGFALVIGQLVSPQPIWALELLKLLMLMLSLGAGVRFGLAGPAMITIMVAIGAVFITAAGAGPFTQGDFYDRLAEAHAFLFATAVAGMLLAAITADLHRAVHRERDAQAALAAASASRIRMLTLISHDLRTPLGAMTTALGTLRGPATAEDRESLIEAGLLAGDTMVTLVNDILATASLDQGQVTLSPASFDLRQSLEHITARHRPRADAKAVALTLQIEPTVPAALFGDRVRVEQIVDNLVGNAVAFTQAGGVTVRCRWTPTLEIEISDTGDGIDPTLVPFIFDAFVKADPGLKSGLGLGLHICSGLARLMGGSIEYRPAVPHGSSFTVALPLPAATATVPDRAGPSAAEPVDILLIEDDPISREITAAWLSSQGHRVTAAATGEDAIAIARQRAFQLVLVDQDLGDGMSGETATAALRALSLPVARVPIVALTGAADAGVALRNSGADVVLSKPIPLTTTVADLLECRTPSP